ncbi:class I SAM-dependent methyltransferase [Demetria terragena]|uniref:class I SAM-dependent methyltransferase n=1 Tax=Demetria terragena TaxID=63959 RepID=UPI000366B4DC|nr:class I SAM-dependent methyltransferase [Demetria terragena]
MTLMESPLDAVYTAALGGEDCQVTNVHGHSLPLPVAQWSRTATDSDIAVLSHCVGTTLDVGCGPGRMTEMLTGRGHIALGVDVVPAAVNLTMARGAMAMTCDVFGPVPGEGNWDTALLADGNVGIGGDPVALLGRLAELITPKGRIVADISPPGITVQRRRLWLETTTSRSRPFPWAEVGVDGIASVAGAAGLGVPQVYRVGARWFAVVRRGR